MNCRGTEALVLIKHTPGTLALSPDRQSPRMSEIKNGMLGLYGKV